MTSLSEAEAHQRVGQSVAELARFHPELLGVMTFGSAARGDDDEGSDLDLLVVRTESVTGRHVHALMKSSLGGLSRRLSILVRSETQLISEIEDRPSFGAHLRDEGRASYERPGWRGFAEALKQAPLERKELDREVRERLAELDVLRPVTRFRGGYVSYLANIYAVGRSVVIAKLLSEGKHRYGWKSIFDEYEKCRPDLSQDLRTVSELRPFFDRLTARTSEEPPVPSEEQARAALKAVEHLAAS